MNDEYKDKTMTSRTQNTTERATIGQGLEHIARALANGKMAREPAAHLLVPSSNGR
jgi:hypothetical protein